LTGIHSRLRHCGLDDLRQDVHPVGSDNAAQVVCNLLATNPNRLRGLARWHGLGVELAEKIYD